jgi:hypothetical protein
MVLKELSCKDLNCNVWLIVGSGDVGHELSGCIGGNVLPGEEYLSAVQEGTCAVKPQSFLLGSQKKNDGYRKIIDARGLYKIGFVQGPQKLNDGSGKIKPLEMMKVSLYCRRYLSSNL